MELQKPLSDELVRLEPLREQDFDALMAIASDPLIWEQHPNSDRYLEPVFRKFFQMAMESRGAYRIVDVATGKVIGSTRYYQFDAAKRSVKIGYTFFARSHWGGRFNPAVKKLMLDHAFANVDRVYLEVGADNRRSRIAVERLGATLVEESDVAMPGEPVRRNALYVIERASRAKFG
jgi:N-acetyltransferase